MQICPLCVTLQCPCVAVKPTYNKWAVPVPALSSCSCFPACFFCLSVHRKLSVPTSALLFVRPAPTAVRAPPQHHHHHCCVTEEQKRECQTPPTRSLSHQNPHLSSRWGCVFSGVSFNPKSPPKWKTPSPLRSPLLSCPSSTCSAATRPWPGHVPSLSHPSGESY